MRIVRQLGREDWILAGLVALAAGGPGAFRVEPVARRLQVSKGSFYWHFRDRAAWRDALLEYWEHLAFATLVRSARTGHGPPAGRQMDGACDFRANGAGSAVEGPRAPAPGAALDIDRLEQAFRLWARDDAWVARAVARVRAERRLPLPVTRPQPARAA